MIDDLFESFSLGNETVNLRLTRHADGLIVYIAYWRGEELKHHFTIDFFPGKIPGELSRRQVRLGASKAFMLRLNEVYAEALFKVFAVGHDELHTDNPDPDLGPAEMHFIPL